MENIFPKKNIFLVIEKNAIYKFSYNLQHRLARKMMLSYMYEPYTFHLGKNVAELTRGLQTDTDNFAKVIIHFIELVMELFVCASLGIYLFVISKAITIITLTIVSVSAISYVLITKERLHRLGQKNQKYNSDIIQYVNQSMGGIKEIKVLGREEYFIKKFSDTFKDNGRTEASLIILKHLPLSLKVSENFFIK